MFHIISCHFLSQFNLTFIDNSALEGSAIYMHSAVQCSWSTSFSPFFDTSSILKWAFVNIR